jgi:hypothetical protein
MDRRHGPDLVCRAGTIIFLPLPFTLADGIVGFFSLYLAMMASQPKQVRPTGGRLPFVPAYIPHRVCTSNKGITMSRILVTSVRIGSSQGSDAR